MKSGNLINNLISNPNYVEPKVGMNVTECLWSDRHANRIIHVSTDKKSFVMARYAAVNTGGVGEQNWVYDDQNGNPILHPHINTEVKFRYGNWYKVVKDVDDNIHYEKINLAFNTRDEYYDWEF